MPPCRILYRDVVCSHGATLPAMHSPHDPSTSTDLEESLHNVPTATNAVVTDISVPATVVASSNGTGLQATLAMCYYCFEVLWRELKQRQPMRKKNPTFPALSTIHSESLLSSTRILPMEDMSPAVECPLFVTWERCAHANASHSSCNGNGRNLLSSKDTAFELRGCIGTLTPKVLSKETLKEYALLSALRDKRFDPVTLEELPRLRVAVSLLVHYEECRDCHDWTVGVHGIIIRFHPHDDNNATSEYSATFLPEVATQQGWDQYKTITQLVRKAGYKGAVTDTLVRRIKCQRYQSSKQEVTFAEYVQMLLPESAAAATAAGTGGNTVVTNQLIANLIRDTSSGGENGGSPWFDSHGTSTCGVM
jgi:AMME syndrome candidate gene 1 protein